MISKKGFSLTELLIVVAVIAVIAGIALPTYRGYRAKSRRAECMGNMAGIMNAARMYYQKTNTPPCRIGVSEDAVHTTAADCNMIGRRRIKFPIVEIGAGDIGKLFYTYGVRPASVNPALDKWFPTPGLNKYGQTINAGSATSPGANLSASADYVVFCLGRIFTNYTRHDEFVLSNRGQIRIFQDNIANMDYSGSGGKVYE